MASDLHQNGPFKRPIILTVYVDDMVMSGPGHVHEWPRLRKLINTNEPAKVSRILGVNFQTVKIDEHKSKVIMHMDKYCEQAVDMYLKVPNAPSLRASVRSLGMSQHPKK